MCPSSLLVEIGTPCQDASLSGINPQQAGIQSVALDVSRNWIERSRVPRETLPEAAGAIAKPSSTIRGPDLRLDECNQA